MDNLVVAAPSLGLVGEKSTKFSEESLPVAGNVLHFQVAEDELLTPDGQKWSFVITTLPCTPDAGNAVTKPTQKSDLLPDSDLLYNGIILFGKLKQLSDIREVLFDGYVVDPRL